MAIRASCPRARVRLARVLWQLLCQNDARCLLSGLIEHVCSHNHQCVAQAGCPLPSPCEAMSNATRQTKSAFTDFARDGWCVFDKVTSCQYNPL